MQTVAALATGGSDPSPSRWLGDFGGEGSTPLLSSHRDVPGSSCVLSAHRFSEDPWFLLWGNSVRPILGLQGEIITTGSPWAAALG